MPIGYRPGNGTLSALLWHLLALRSIDIVNENGRAPAVDAGEGDDILARRVAIGDVAAFSLLYDRYARIVYALAAHVLGGTDADEMVQEVFFKLWLKANQFDPSRGTFRTWFMAIARHGVLRELGTRSRRQRAQTGEDIEIVLSRVADSTSDVEALAWSRDESRSLLAGLAALPPEQRRVLILAYFSGLSQSAIAEQLGLPLGTVKKRTRLGMQKLRQALAPLREPELPEAAPTRNPPSALSKARKSDGM